MFYLCIKNLTQVDYACFIFNCGKNIQHEIYHLDRFKVYGSVVLSMFIVLLYNPSPERFHLAKINSTPVKQLPISPLPLSPWRPPSTFCLHRSDYSRYFM